MGTCFLDGVQVGDDGRDATGRDDLPPLVKVEAPVNPWADAFAALDAATLATIQTFDKARVAYWKTPAGWADLEHKVPGLVCPPVTKRDVLRMEAVAEGIGEDPRRSAAEGRDMRALRLYAAEVRAAHRAEAA